MFRVRQRDCFKGILFFQEFLYLTDNKIRIRLTHLYLDKGGLDMWIKNCGNIVVKRGRIWFLHLSIEGAGQRLTTGANMTERTGKIVKRIHEMKVNGPTKNGQAKIHSTSMREAIVVNRMTSNKPG